MRFLARFFYCAPCFEQADWAFNADKSCRAPRVQWHYADCQNCDDQQSNDKLSLALANLPSNIPRHGRVAQPRQDNAASAPSRRPKCPKRKPEMTDLIGVG
jgi:hypothetical protein